MPYALFSQAFRLRSLVVRWYQINHDWEKYPIIPFSDNLLGLTCMSIGGNEPAESLFTPSWKIFYPTRQCHVYSTQQLGSVIWCTGSARESHQLPRTRFRRTPGYRTLDVIFWKCPLFNRTKDFKFGGFHSALFHLRMWGEEEIVQASDSYVYQSLASFGH